MPIPIAPGNTVVFCGDSITNQGVFLPAVNMINLALTPRQSGAAQCVSGRGNAIGSAGIARAATIAQQPINAIMSGVPGNTAASIAADVPGRITNYNPDVVVLFVGVNDAISATALATFNANMDTIFAGIAAYDADVPTLVLSIFTYGEEWAAGPVWNNPLDPPPSDPGYTPSIAQYNSETQTAIGDSALTDCDYLDLRAPTLVYEAANNTPEPGTFVGPFTFDGTHPSSRGQNWISNLVFGECVIS